MLLVSYSIFSYHGLVVKCVFQLVSNFFLNVDLNNFIFYRSKFNTSRHRTNTNSSSSANRRARLHQHWQFHLQSSSSTYRQLQTSSETSQWTRRRVHYLWGTFCNVTSCHVPCDVLSRVVWRHVTCCVMSCGGRYVQIHIVNLSWVINWNWYQSIKQYNFY